MNAASIQIQRKLERRVVVNVCNGSDSEPRTGNNACCWNDRDKADFQSVVPASATKNAEASAARIFDLSNIGEEILLGVSHVEEHAILGRHSHSGMLQIFLDHNRKSNRSKLEVSRSRLSSAGNALGYQNNSAITAKNTIVTITATSSAYSGALSDHFSICARTLRSPLSLAISGRVKFSTGAPAIAALGKAIRGVRASDFRKVACGPTQFRRFIPFKATDAHTNSLIYPASSLPDMQANWRQARYSKLAEPDAPSHTAQWECAV